MYTVNMKRTQIYLDEGDHKELQALARRQKVTMAHLVRHFVERGIEEVRQEVSGRQNTLAALVELGVTGGPEDLSSHLDQYLYGSEA